MMMSNVWNVKSVWYCVSFVNTCIAIFVCFTCINKTFCNVAKLFGDSKHIKCPLDSNNKLNKSDIGPWVDH